MLSLGRGSKNELYSQKDHETIPKPRFYGNKESRAFILALWPLALRVTPSPP